MYASHLLGRLARGRLSAAVTSPDADRLDPGRLAAAVGLASGAVQAESDEHALLAQLGQLVAAPCGLLVLGDVPRPVVLAAIGCPPGTVGLTVDADALALPAIVLGGVTETLVVGLSVRDRRVGVLELGRPAGPAFSVDDRTLVDLVSARFALLVERHRLQLAGADARGEAADALAALRLKEGRVEAMLAPANDSLIEMQALHAAVVQTIVDGVVVIDHRGRIEWTNDAAWRMFGYDAGALVGQNVRMLMPEPDASHHDGYLSRYLTTGERKIIGIGRDVRGKRKDGSEFPLYLAVGEMQLLGVRKFTGILRDLTETKRLEHLLQERQTLARIGELAAVVAHEVRNPLAAIRGVVEVMQTRFPADSSDRKVLGDLLARVDSLDHLVSDLLVYAHPAPPVFRRVSMLGLARDTAALVTNDRGTGAMRFDVSGEDAQLWLDPAQMGRALLNLITNAAQASPKAGVVRITGERHHDRYLLRVADEGPGMAADVAVRCLEPFFTTKTRGTGLGLPIAKRVVDEHSGGFEVESAPGAGTRVTLSLPLGDRHSVAK